MKAECSGDYRLMRTSEEIKGNIKKEGKNSNKHEGTQAVQP